MNTENKAPLIRLEDYRPSDYRIDTVDLDIQLHPTLTRVKSTLEIRLNVPERQGAPLELDGGELLLESIALNGKPLDSSAYQANPNHLTLFNPPEAFTLTIETIINPAANTKLSGLYRSSDVFTTQCEAEGFRRITYFIDRPDILSVYTVRVKGSRKTEPVLLSNGNLIDAGKLGNDRHYAVWHDPHPKPSYLFALVGGDLDELQDSFTTKSGRSVKLGIYVEKGNRRKAFYAMDSLKRSMLWDEKVYNCEYDLDVFNIVAVSDFNMGAMENKGLNIFNDKYVLASAQTATDTDYAGIESVIAHEYFHNWTGNRITCRDWFQLCLKEGLTVFRDQEFSSDERSRPVIRINDVRTLRARQFTEDAGPLAHPVRPGAYKEINNFYTATVYEKGAEIIRMLKTLIGDAAFFKGMGLYFERYDGTAATIEQFIGCFADASGMDLTHFSKWYGQAGTPKVTVTHSYDAEAETLTVSFRQKTPPTPGQAHKEPLVLPVLMGLVAYDGSLLAAQSADIRDGLFVFDREEAVVTFSHVKKPAVPSLFRNFSAPVNLVTDLGMKEHAALLAYDTDPFNRWQAAQNIALSILKDAVAKGGQLDEESITIFSSSLELFLDKAARQDPAFSALVLTMPGEAEIAREIGTNLDPDVIHLVCRTFRQKVGQPFIQKLKTLYEELDTHQDYSPDAASAGNRSLRNAALSLIAAADEEVGYKLCTEQLKSASNMTDRLAALAVLASLQGQNRENALIAFAHDYADEPLVLDKWFAIQATMPEDGVLKRIEHLQNHKAFSIYNPNRVRALIGAFAMSNQKEFHRKDGKGYEFIGEFLEKLDVVNPQVASMIGKSFSSWNTMEPERQKKAEAVLRHLATRKLSRDLSEIIEKTLEA